MESIWYSYLDDRGAVGYYSGVGLGLTLRVTTIMMAACLNKLQALELPACNTACNAVETGGVMTASFPSDEVVSSEEGGEGGEVKFLPPPPVEVLGYLSVVLPAVRIVFDWILCQDKLYFSARASTKLPLL